MKDWPALEAAAARRRYLSPSHHRAAFELKRFGEEGAFSGFAPTFGPPADSQGDIVGSDAFSAHLGEHAEKGTASMRRAGAMPALAVASGTPTD